MQFLATTHIDTPRAAIEIEGIGLVRMDGGISISVAGGSSGSGSSGGGAGSDLKIFNVTDYGAVLDGIADDTTALETCMAAAQSYARARDKYFTARPTTVIAKVATWYYIAPGGLTGLQIIDGVQLVDGDVVLVTSAASNVDNGLYRAHAGAWTRHENFDSSGDWVHDTTVIEISDGTYWKGQRFRFIFFPVSGFILGTSPIELWGVPSDGTRAIVYVPPGSLRITHRVHLADHIIIDSMATWKIDYETPAHPTSIIAHSHCDIRKLTIDCQYKNGGIHIRHYDHRCFCTIHDLTVLYPIKRGGDNPSSPYLEDESWGYGVRTEMFPYRVSTIWVEGGDCGCSWSGADSYVDHMFLLSNRLGFFCRARNAVFKDVVVDFPEYWGADISTAQELALKLKLYGAVPITNGVTFGKRLQEIFDQCRTVDADLFIGPVGSASAISVQNIKNSNIKLHAPNAAFVSGGNITTAVRFVDKNLEKETVVVDAILDDTVTNIVRYADSNDNLISTIAAASAYHATPEDIRVSNRKSSASTTALSMDIFGAAVNPWMFKLSVSALINSTWQHWETWVAGSSIQNGAPAITNGTVSTTVVSSTDIRITVTPTGGATLTAIAVKAEAIGQLSATGYGGASTQRGGRVRFSHPAVPRRVYARHIVDGTATDVNVSPGEGEIDIYGQRIR